MSKKIYKTAKEGKDEVREPSVTYEAKNGIAPITFSTNKEQEESNYLYWLSLTPEERWAEHFKLLQSVYGKIPFSKNNRSRIVFDA